MYHIVLALLGGGTGKSTTAINLGHALALKGLRTLVIDADRQGQCAIFLGRNPEPNLHTWLGGNLVGIKEPLGNLIRETGRRRLYLLPGSRETEILQRMLVAFDSPVSWLKSQIEMDGVTFDQFDVILWDTSPAGRLLDMILYLADLAILPTPADVKGQSSLVDTLGILPPYVRRVILPTRFQAAQVVNRDFLHGLGTDYPGQVFRVDGESGFVPERAAVRTAQALGQTIFEYDPKGEVATVYQRLAASVVAGMEGGR